ncbi:PadR family transcriptional regulator [Actinoplanes ianthinogenes]|uniref:PadR family transcriptional regulator n=1 Tax=Actinoplanes ianthinogenes TaxID=122358 RepID=A0ABN6CS11_9ACTN|nr:PadR family transcriptional regulator [Actinoplanes ianthinogenes]BCJ47932.1 PadR family transcriptional regulator [Actinoplanes ianthinogenes]GGR05175.1 PadR family transcriptional regulator [Actinoplanes ianthinogenes]
MVRARRPSAQTILVLGALAEEPSVWRYGYELGQQVGLKAGSLYPILVRLHDRGLLESSWESEPSPGRPPRHLYRLTGDGLRWAAEVTAEAAPRGAVGPSRLQEA